MSDKNPNDGFRQLRLLTLPHVGILIGVVLSFIAWSLPAFSVAGKGFVAPSTPANAVVWTVITYLGIAGASAAGFFVGIPLGRRFPKMDPQGAAGLRSNGVWTFWILLASVGVLFALAKVFGAMGIGGCIRCIMSFNANGMKAVLYTDYNMGILTFRYVAILAGGIAVFRYLAYREVSLRTFLSLGLLMVVAVMSSRLSLIWAVVIGGTTYVLAPIDQGKRRIRMVEILAWSGVFVVVIGALTISRTFGYYEKKGADTFVTAACSEFQRYLAAPFQGSIQAVNYPERRSRLNESAGIDGELSTNSALLEAATSVGKWNIVVLAAVLFASGLACGALQHFRSTYFIVMLGVLQSCHLEVWRILMFPTGITVTLLSTAFVVPMALSLVKFPTIRLPVFKLRLQ